MFSQMSPQRSSAPMMASSLYRQVGIASAMPDASPHRLVAMLFDGLIESVTLARGALAAGDHERKGREIGRAVRILEEGLKASLDLRAGGALATDLRDLYAYAVLRLTQANLRNDDAALVECQSLLQPLRDAWASIAPREAA